MLEVKARSFKGRICTYTNDDISISTPYIVGNEDNISLTIGDKGRVFKFFDSEISLDDGLLTTEYSGIVKPIRNNGKISVVRTPLPETLTFSNDTEIVVLANAFEIISNPRVLIDVTIKLREAVGSNVLIYYPGAALPSNMTLLAYMGVDLFDYGYCDAMKIMNKHTIPEGIFQLKDGDNRKELQRELSIIYSFINNGRLRELVDQRASSSPVNVATLRLFDDLGYEYQKKSIDKTMKRFCCNTTQSLRRPDVKEYRERLLKEYRKPKHKKILVLLPCSAKKPYHTSKTHRRFASAIHFSDIETIVHEVIVTSPLGIVPRELDIFYPANAYDIPVTGEWKCEERKFIREMISFIVSQGYDAVISHLGDESLIDGICEYKNTVVGDATSPASLKNLENAIRDAAKGLEKCDYMIDRKETVRSALSFQFGKDVADVIMNEETYAIGKYPYWKIIREKIQLGMMSLERGAFSLTIDGGNVLMNEKYNIVEMMDFELKGNLFAVGVINANNSIIKGDECVVLKNGKVVAVGTAEMSGEEMRSLKRGIAVKIRHKIK